MPLKRFFSIAFAASIVAQTMAQECAPLSQDIQLSGRICLDGICLNATDFQGVKVQYLYDKVIVI